MLEDFLEPNRLSLEHYRDTFRGSWVFGYVEALQAAGSASLLVLISKSVREPTPMEHRPTGTQMIALPPPRPYRAIAPWLANPYGRRAADTFALRESLRPFSALLEPLRELSPYVSTPIVHLSRVLHEYGCSALLCQEYEFPRFDVCAMLSRHWRVPVFGVFQGGDYQRWRLERLTRRLAVRSSDGLICASETERHRVCRRYGISASDVAIIPNPVDVEVWRPTDRDRGRAELGLPVKTKVVVWHGRVDVWKKGLDVLLDAWELLRRSSPQINLRLVLLGDGRDAQSIIDRLEHQRRDDVLFLNRVSDDPEEIRQVLGAGDVYVFPSRHEGFPVAPLEAMACGLPLVATDVSGIREMLPAGEHSGGVVVPPEDPEALAAALERLLRDEELSRAIARHARERAVAAFSYHVVGRQLVDFLSRRIR